MIYSPSSSSKPVWKSLFCWTQRKIFWRMWETEQFWGTIDLHSIFFSYYGSQWCPKTAWLQTFFKISSFVFGRTKKFIQVWNYLRVSKWWQNFHFWVNYPFKFKQLSKNQWTRSDRADDFSQLVILCSCLCMPVEHTNTGKQNDTNSEKSEDL